MHRLLPALGLLLACTGVHAQAPEARFAPDRLIVRLAEPDALTPGAEGAAAQWSDASLADLAAASGVASARRLFPAASAAGDAGRLARARALRAELGLDAIYVLGLQDSADVEELAARWAAHPAVVFAEPDFAGAAAGARGPEAELAPTRGGPAPVVELPNDTHFPRQWGHHNTGANPNIPSPVENADVNAPEAWEITLGSSDLVIAIIDSGLRLGHPDIAARVWTNAGETANGTDDDGNGLIDDVYGWDWVNNDNDPSDDNGHGSNIAGLVGAIGNNELGYAGLDRAARLMILKSFNASLSFFYSWTISSVMYAVDHGAHVINLSGGGTDYSAAFEAAANYAHGLGVVFTASMMNFNNDVTYYPAAFPTVVAVGATNARDERAVPFCWGGGSNYGPHIDLSAPGDRIYSITHSSDTNYNVYWCGTSMAAPYVAATASLMLSVRPELTPDELRAILRATAVDGVGRPTEDTPGFDVYHGHGRLDAAAALTMVTTAADPAPEPGRLALTAVPNPVRRSATLVLVVPGTGHARVAVYDALGREVAVLLDGTIEAGARTLRLDASALPTGVYVVRAVTATGATSRRLTVVR